MSESRTGKPGSLTDVKSEQIRIVFASTPTSLFTILVVSLLLLVIQWQVVDHGLVITWFSLTNLLSIYRLYLYRKFNGLADGSLVDDVWRRHTISTSMLSGLCWGAGGFFMFAEHSLVHQVFIGFVIAGICAGAITTLSAIRPAVRGFVLCAMVPTIVKFSLIDNEISLPMTVLSVLFTAMILVSAKRLHQIIVESLEVRHQYELAERTIRRQANFDDLTDLPNRRYLLETLRREIDRSYRHGRHGAIFFVDLDRFKSINDSLGHAIGDELLICVARKLGQRLRKEDTVARLGGDEFVVLLPEVGRNEAKAADHAASIASQIRNLFVEPMLIQGHEIHLSLSIGIALFPSGVSAEDLIKHADVAMYQVKSEGRDNARLFSQEMQEAVIEQRSIEKGLRQALANDEFELYFQAQYNRAGEIVGAETLLRWNHPQKGVLAPGYFIEIAENSGLIVPIGDWVLRAACERLADINPAMTLSVNVSPRQFGDPNFIEQLEQVLRQTAADTTKLRFEITESLAISNIEHTIATMKRLKELGISFSMDDFGTGHSSLNNLYRLPIDELKIDQSFVRNISASSDNAVIVDTILAMARQLELTTVAEGIETTEEFEHLHSRGCENYQGYYFARPQPFADFSNEMRNSASGKNRVTVEPRP